MIPEKNRDDEIYPEHMNRYFFASQLVKGKIVLDIACGSGYGADLLQRAGAEKVYGVDISKESIDYCKEKYKSEKIEFLAGGMESIPINNGEIDVIVSMETIEHVDEQAQRKFLAEAKRVLKSDGIFVVSTPNSLVYPNGNPFHKKELDPLEFENFLKEKFQQVKIYYQDNILSNFIMSANNLKKDFIYADIGIRARKANCIAPKNSLYLVAVCSDKKLDSFEEYLTISNIKHVDFQNIFLQKDQEIEKLKRFIQQKKKEFIKKDNYCNYEVEEATIELNKKLKEKEKELEHMKSSKFWKIREKYLGLKRKMKMK